jgi:hypothetical protein
VYMSAAARRSGTLFPSPPSTFLFFYGLLYSPREITHSRYITLVNLLISNHVYYSYTFCSFLGLRARHPRSERWNWLLH